MGSKIQVVGNVTRDPELKQTAGGNPACRLSLACNTQRDREGNQKPIYFSAAVYGRQAEACARHLSKGDKVFVCGDFEPYEYVGKDGVARTSYNINFPSVEFITTTPREEELQTPQPQTRYEKAAKREYVPIDDDDFDPPF